MSTVGSSNTGLTVPSGLANAGKLTNSVQNYGNAVDQQYVDTFGKLTYPASYTAFSGKEAEIQNIRSRIRQASNVTYPIGDQDIQNVLKIREAYRKYLYDRHFVQLLDQYKTDPATLDKFRNLYPDFFRIRLEYVTQVAKLQARVAALKLNGLQTKEDLDFVLSTNILSREEMFSLNKLLSTPVNLLDTLDSSSTSYPHIVPNARHIGLNLGQDSTKLAFGKGGLLQFAPPTQSTYTLANLGLGTRLGTFTPDNIVNVKGGNLATPILNGQTFDNVINLAEQVGGFRN